MVVRVVVVLVVEVIAVVVGVLVVMRSDVNVHLVVALVPLVICFLVVVGAV